MTGLARIQGGGRVVQLQLLRFFLSFAVPTSWYSPLRKCWQCAVLGS